MQPQLDGHGLEQPDRRHVRHRDNVQRTGFDADKGARRLDRGDAFADVEGRTLPSSEFAG
jgi:hypothetical protein